MLFRLTAFCLQRLEAQCPGFLDSVDLFVGTSTGSILAAGLASGISIEKCAAMSEKVATKIFSISTVGKIKTLDGFLAPSYDPQVLKSSLSAEFGSTTMGSLKRKFMCTSFASKV